MVADQGGRAMRLQCLLKQLAYRLRGERQTGDGADGPLSRVMVAEDGTDVVELS